MDRVKLLRNLTARLDDKGIEELRIISWACPVPFFGNLDAARVATVGLNPSNREFVSADGVELDCTDRRFPTLTSLGLDDWRSASASQLRKVDLACSQYFSGKPYDAWFRVLDKLIVGLNHSYYGMFAEACHLDLCPYATSTKWGELPNQLKASLLDVSGDFLGDLIAGSQLRVLILNGQTVIRTFEAISGTKLVPSKIDEWTLPRSGGRGVDGISYFGRIARIGQRKLAQEITVLGYSHNIQSSFGVTTQVRESISSWITTMAGLEYDLLSAIQPT
ncbi:MAG: hypothetical protein ACJ8LG_24090 [Massilia sp.]